jgi:serine/threonine protein kinase
VGVCSKYPNMCLVLEYFPLGDLQRNLRNRGDEIGLAMVIKLAMDIVAGMIYLHERQIVHLGLFSPASLIRFD